MIWVYLNYPQPEVSVHGNSRCPEIQKMGKPNQRVVNLNYQTILNELGRFRRRQYHFGSTSDEYVA